MEATMSIAVCKGLKCNLEGLQSHRIDLHLVEVNGRTATVVSRQTAFRSLPDSHSGEFGSDSSANFTT